MKGFWHEQARPDRDEYISIDWNNIRDGKESNFSKQSSKIDSLGAPYDYKSVMHYNAKALTSNAIGPASFVNSLFLYNCMSTV